MRVDHSTGMTWNFTTIGDKILDKLNHNSIIPNMLMQTFSSTKWITIHLQVYLLFLEQTELNCTVFILFVLLKAASGKLTLFDVAKHNLFIHFFLEKKDYKTIFQYKLHRYRKINKTTILGKYPFVSIKSTNSIFVLRDAAIYLFVLIVPLTYNMCSYCTSTNSQCIDQYILNFIDL